MIITKKHGRVIFVISQFVFLIGFLVFFFFKLSRKLEKKMSDDTYDWKRKNEKGYLQIKPWLNRLPIRHAKVLMKPLKETIRG